MVNLVFLVLPFVSCDEHLPPRSDPSQLFSARIESTWLMSPLENRIYLRLIMKNTYDEMIEGYADIEGTLSITLQRDPSYARSYDLGWRWVDQVPPANLPTGFMRIPPGDSMSFFIPFDWKDDLGRDFRSGLIYQPDPVCTGRLIAMHEVFIIRAEARLFPKLSPTTARPLLFELCHVDVWVSPQVCPPILSPTQGCLEYGWGR